MSRCCKPGELILHFGYPVDEARSLHRETMIADVPEIDQLDEKQLAFVVEWAHDWNRTQAAIRAGYSKEDAAWVGSQLSRKPQVRKAVRAIQMARANEVTMDMAWAIDQFLHIYIQANEQGDFKSAIKALENISKMMGYYEKDNRQKNAIGEMGLAELKAKLLARGVDVDRWAARSKN